MRIAVLINLSPRKLGSLEGWLVALCEESRRRGYAVDVYGRDPIHPEVLASLQALGVGWRTVDWLEASPLRAVRRLAAYDVIHLNMFQPRTQVAMLAYAAWPARVLMVDHSSGPVPATERNELVSGVLRRAADRFSMVRVDHLAGVSNYVRDRDQRRFELPAHRVRTIYNGVDVKRFAPRREASSPPERTSMVAVAYLIPQKGVETLLYAMARMRWSRTPLTMVGDGPEAGRLKALAIRLGISSRVHFAGVRDDIPQLIDEADIFVHPALWAEAFGLSIAEAMATERAVVASRIGGIPELVQHGESGLLVEPGNAAELAEALDSLVAHPHERLRLARNARQRVIERFELRGCVDAHLGWMEEAMALPPPVPRHDHNTLVVPEVPRPPRIAAKPARGTNAVVSISRRPLFGPTARLEPQATAEPRSSERPELAQEPVAPQAR
ncbi:MAG TPA: glycosyltransferase family 4 protein [Myxococcaceae bacterium]|nr:glycosyltransferase family 4 protein [Myxococcaceae bacterium]